MQQIFHMKFTAVICLLFITQIFYGQNDSLSSQPVHKEFIVKSVIKDQAKIWSSPFRMKKRDLKVVIPILSATAAAIIFDEQIYREIKNFQFKNKWVDDVSPIITYMGDDKAIQSASTLFLIGGFAFKNDKAKQTALMGYQTFIHSGIVIQVFKHLAGRQRPSVDDGVDKWNGPAAMFKRYTESFSRYDAFPSGHTIMAVSLATVISEQYKEHKWVPITMYSLAAISGLSRVTEDTHWLSDIIIGGSLGYGIGKFITSSHQNTKWTLLPNYSKQNVSMTALYSF